MYNEVGWVPLSQRRKENKLLILILHKIVQGLAPNYLNDLLPPLVGQDMQYHLRNFSNFIEPLCRLEIYKKSFFPSAISLWNSLPLDVRNIHDIGDFKRLIVKKPRPIPNHYFIGERKFSIFHTRLRNNCSNLNYDLLVNHISLSGSCSCGDASETAFHYLLVCRNFTTEREHMFRLLDMNSLPRDINYLLFRSETLTEESNCKIFEIVQKYIKETRRFTSD